ncbi:hypothetical protein [Chitinophaga rhizophila]|uniref:DUF1735 domain-containing protein n=1 Tax=Chitinophaga rhizophila TaxID=2866212 RepID=A0ABS7GKP2_9BACT|nr:hypothetical protein [Chitinophaga rhizophila]MBW8688302.1 hypothetical protein [Chitinophaga rhizophila]
MKQQLQYMLMAAGMTAMVACSKTENAVPVVPPPATVSFSSTVANIDMNGSTTSFSVVIPVSGATKADLESKFKLIMTDSATNKVDTSLAVTKTTVSESPLQVTVEINAKHTYDTAKRTVFVTIDSTALPVASGANTKLAVRIMPFAPAATWFKNESFYAPNTYYFNEATQKWATIPAHFSVLDSANATVLGFVNNYVAESGVPFLNMMRIYNAEMGGGSTSAKTAKINVPRALRLIPATPGARKGTVEVINQDVVVTRKDGTTFNVSFSGTGTFDMDTKLIEIDVNFDDSAFGGAAVNKYSYKFSVDKLTL